MFNKKKVIKEKNINSIVPVIQTTKKEINKHDDEDDYEDFDFSMYDKLSEDSEEQIEDINRIPRTNTNKTKAKYSPHFLGLERLERMRVQITRCSIKVAANTQYIQDLWDLYGSLNEYWANIKDLSGRYIYDQTEDLFIKMAKHIYEQQQKDYIDYNTHRLLLALRDKVYIISQRLGFSFEVDFKNSSFYAKAKRGIQD